MFQNAEESGMLTIGKPLNDMELGELSRVRVGPFLMRLLIFLGLTAGLMTVILSTSGVVSFLAMVVLGLVYTHGVELQHQALHNTAFPSRFWNRFVGFFLGLPMLVSYSDYQHSHLRHHRLLGTADDREFFNYDYDRLTTLKPLLAHLLMVRHYRDVTGFIVGSVLGRTKSDIKRETALKIRAEYRWFTLFIVTAVAVSVTFPTTALLKLWFVPLLVAIPAHALIELPEHWGRDHGTLDVRVNTRTIRTGAFGYWYTNGNNYHIEHHWLPAVPNDKLAYLHSTINDEIEMDTYPAFFKRFFADLYRNTTAKGRQGGVEAA
jgi:fatty acid desaturase